MDNITGTSGNDTIIADNTDAAKLQLTVADTINGSTGTDTLKVYQAAATTSFPAATISGVEKLYLNGGALAALDASLISGLTAVEMDGAVQTNAAGSTVTITTSGQAITLSNQKGTVVDLGTGTTAVAAFVTKLTSTADTSASVTLNKVTSSTHKYSSDGVASNDLTATDTQTLDIAGTKVATLNLASTGAANTITLTNSATGNALATLNLSGDKALTLTENLAGLNTINASTATGNVTVNAGSANAALAFTGGTGNDKLVLNAGTLVSTQTLNGGDGTDTLVIKDTAISAATTALNAAANKVTNFEVMGFGGTALSADLSKITAFSKFSVEAAITGAGDAVGVTFSGQANTQSVLVNANITGGTDGGAASSGQTGLKIAAALDTGANSVDLTLAGVTITGSAAVTTNANGGSAVDLTNYETVTLHSNTNAAGTVTTNTLTAGAKNGTGVAGSGMLLGANASLTIDGAAAVNLGSVVSNPGQALNNNLTLNAGSLTGKLTVTTGSGNDVITGGSGVNLITLGGGADSVDLSKSVAKADVITVASATGTLKSGIAITGFTNVLNTGDSLDLAGATAVTTSGTATVNSGLANAVTATINAKGLAAFSAVGTSVSVGDYVDAVFAAINGTGKAAAFVVGSDTYVVQNNAADATFNLGTDVVVKLVGLSGVAGLSTVASAGDTIFIA